MTNWTIPIFHPTATIANAASLSGAVTLENGTPLLIYMPSAWTAAALTFQVSYDGTTYVDLYDTSGEYSIAAATVGASRAIKIAPELFAGAAYVKVRSGTTAAAVNQGGERIIRLACRPV